MGVVVATICIGGAHSEHFTVATFDGFRWLVEVKAHGQLTDLELAGERTELLAR